MKKVILFYRSDSLPTAGSGNHRKMERNTGWVLKQTK